MPYVELLPVPQDPEALIAYLQTNFRRIQDALARTAGTYDNDDIEINTSSKGFVVTAPNGNRYRLGASNAGALTITLI